MLCPNCFKMIYLIDTNIFLRVLIKNNNDTVHDDCVRLLKKAQNKSLRCQTSSVVLSEVAWTLKSFYGFAKSDIVNALTSINNLHLQVNDNYQTVVAVNKYNKNNVKFIDALIASIPEIQNGKMTIISYDKDFDKLGVKRMEPNHVNML